MSLNLIRTILENPGCAKGSSWALLIAMADRADDDGKGVYASMRVMAEICGISERTAWDALKPLLEAKIVIDTGNIHDWGSGHFTRVYDIDQSAILTVGMQALQKSAKSALRCGKRKTPVQNLQSRVQISHANQSLNQSPSPSAQESAHGLASSLVSSEVADATSTPEPSGSASQWSQKATELVKDILMFKFGLSNPDHLPDSQVHEVMDELQRHLDPESDTALDWLDRALDWGLAHKKFWADRLIDPKSLARALSNTDTKGFLAM